MININLEPKLGVRMKAPENEAFHLHLHLPLVERPALWNICRHYDITMHASMVDRRIQKLFSSFPQLTVPLVEIW